MKKKIILSYGVLFCIFAVSIATAQIPQWYTTQNHPHYPKSSFLLGVGSGSGTNGLDAAKKAALTELVSQLRVQVQSETKNVTKSYKMNDDEDLYSDFKKQTRTVVSDEISGAEIAETFVNPSTNSAYALAVLDKNIYSQSIASELESGWKQASDLRTQAKEYFMQGRLTEAIQNINQIRQVIAPLFAKQVLHDAVAAKSFTSPNVFNPNALQSDIRELLSKVVIEKKFGDKQKGKIGEQFPIPLMVAVYVKSEQKNIPCSGVFVEFLYDGKTMLATGVTDEHGNAAIATTIKPVVSGGIQAQLSLPDLGKEFQKNILASAVIFQWTATASDKKFTVQVNSRSEKISKNITKKLAQAITKAGFAVVPVSNLLLVVETQAGIPVKVEGMAGILFSSELEVSVVLSDKKSGSIIGAAKFTAKGIGKTESEGLEKASANLKIGEKEITALLEK